jgi:TonB family protein
MSLGKAGGMRTCLQTLSLGLGAIFLIGAGQVPPAPSPPDRTLVQYVRTALSCGGVAVEPTEDVTPFGEVWYAPQPNAAGTRTLRFHIDAEGRAVGIDAVSALPAWTGGTADLAPSLAATGFAKGALRQDCTAVYRRVETRLRDASATDLARYWATPHRDNNGFDRAVYEALLPKGSDCDRNWPEPEALHFPFYERFPQRRGTVAALVLRFDLDAKGRTRNVAPVVGSGNAAFDRAAAQAVAHSKYQAGPRTGCIVRFNRRPVQPIPAPAAPDVARFASSDCKTLPDWKTMPPLTFPEPFNRRNLEGWAIIGFDVAPWGATGNLKVLASEPAAEFGEAAKGIVARATLPESKLGRSGCAEIVRFVIRPGGPAPFEAVPVPVIAVD